MKPKVWFLYRNIGFIDIEMPEWADSLTCKVVDKSAYDQVVEVLKSARNYLDMLAYIPANGRMRNLNEDLWEQAMFERDKIDLFLKDSCVEDSE